ncbi:exodeoxyribonuclease VIII-like protein [Pectobacterium polaris]|uniref:exodeoxyribonuclease VIII-like protein n=1 Tax=Pectobacterium polaris TaxID=2042057 RepID=UPI00202D8E71|nr:exodeoxyribonuclease VIII-like protein [Pectobacterium polaris]MCL6324027.1 exodeoxyribonuclease VIII-like protein [Pectobacterium polaris]
MPNFIVDYDPKKSALKNGAVSLAITVDAKNKKLAEMSATMKMEEEFPGASDNFLKPRVIEDAIGSPRPALNKFDEVFPKENEVVDGVWRRIEAPAQANDLVDFSTLSLREKIAAFALYAQAEITEHEFSMVCDYLDLPEGDGDADADTDRLIRVLSGIAALEQVTDALLLSVVNTVSAQFQSISDVPESEILAFVNTLTCAPGETDTTAKKPPVAGLDRERQYTHTYAMLDKEVAAALVRDAADCWELTADHVRESNVLINQNGEEFQRWSTELRMAENALKIPRPVVFALVSEGKKRPELLKDANARRQFVVDFLAEHMPSESTIPQNHKAEGGMSTEEEEEQARENLRRGFEEFGRKTDAIFDNSPQVENLGRGRFSIDGLTGEPASNQGEKTEVASATNAPDAETKQPETEALPAETVTQAQSGVAAGEPISDSTALQAKEALDQLGYGVYATETDAPAPAPAPAPADDFQQRAEAIEAEIAKKTDGEQENLNIWKRVQRTDPRYTKPLAGAGFEGTSINSEYMIMRATEIFGPVGSGWGYRVLEEKMIPGAPLSESLYDDNKKFIGVKLLRDADGSLISELNHSLKIAFWYLNDESERSEIEAYGATPYMYKTKTGIKADSEVMKKSLTDSIKKALSLLGFSADVWLGMHDNPEYAIENAIEFQIKNASDRAEDTVRLRTELDEKFTKNAATLEKAVNVNEVNKVFGTIARELEVHRKNAEAKGDTEHARYLAGRLRRLNQIKDERIAALNATEGEKA